MKNVIRLFEYKDDTYSLAIDVDSPNKELVDKIVTVIKNILPDDVVISMIYDWDTIVVSQCVMLKIRNVNMYTYMHDIRSEVNNILNVN